MILHKMDRSMNGFNVSRRKDFCPLRALPKEFVKSTFDFAYEMSFGRVGEHRAHRSGGLHHRRKGEIFADTFQGKLSEFSIYDYLGKKCNLNVPDTSTYGLGEWDDSDFDVNGKKISIKSTKRFGNLILLERKDWNHNGEYLPNLMKGKSVYDFFILVRIDPFCESILKNIKAYYSDTQNRQSLEDLILSNNWVYDIPGFATHDDIVYAIRNEFVIEQGDYLNNSVEMDASNYYIQAGDLRNIDDIIELLERE